VEVRSKPELRGQWKNRIRCVAGSRQACAVGPARSPPVPEAEVSAQEEGLYFSGPISRVWAMGPEALKPQSNK